MAKAKYRLSALFPEDTMADLAVVQAALQKHSVISSGSVSEAVRHCIAMTAEILRGVPGAVPTRPYVGTVVRAMQARS